VSEREGEKRVRGGERKREEREDKQLNASSIINIY